MNLSGPVIRGKVGFTAYFEKRDIDRFAVVNAIVLENNTPARFAAALGAPERLWTGTVRTDWQIRAGNTLAASFSSNANLLSNQNVGGFNLPSAGYNGEDRNQALRLTDTQVFGSGVLNEFRVGVTAVQARRTPFSSAPAILVPGAFIGGGAVSQSLNRHDYTLEAADTVGWVRGRHSVKLGFQLYDFLIRENTSAGFNGSFLFGGDQGRTNSYRAWINIGWRCSVNPAARRPSTRSLPARFAWGSNSGGCRASFRMSGGCQGRLL